MDLIFFLFSKKFHFFSAEKCCPPVAALTVSPIWDWKPKRCGGQKAVG